MRLCGRGRGAPAAARAAAVCAGKHGVSGTSTGRGSRGADSPSRNRGVGTVDFGGTRGTKAAAFGGGDRQWLYSHCAEERTPPVGSRCQIGRASCRERVRRVEVAVRYTIESSI